MGGSCEHGIESSVFIKDGEFPDWLNDYWSRDSSVV
jgi:hypothetical protein